MENFKTKAEKNPEKVTRKLHDKAEEFTKAYIANYRNQEKCRKLYKKLQEYEDNLPKKIKDGLERLKKRGTLTEKQCDLVNEDS